MAKGEKRSSAPKVHGVSSRGVEIALSVSLAVAVINIDDLRTLNPEESLSIIQKFKESVKSGDITASQDGAVQKTEVLKFAQNWANAPQSFKDK